MTPAAAALIIQRGSETSEYAAARGGSPLHRGDAQQPFHQLVDVVPDGGGGHLLEAGGAEAAEEDVQPLGLSDGVQSRDHV
eukprot:CAMPEP_0202777712 /NCGR_PEP_ID=MMETSP1388-20130828/53225_1 /ASSEMBLY_ACC=CAM_ASM_000864 /TAXON_ID=37098 /ORGANISM="Isochrysis sp, Strain CCMP1244" /LENGTH=80 /DNA_ID=CAMNT_0049446955 /DNA_START=205 /DNA_END=449 /DNA_ORIENTATION=+